MAVTKLIGTTNWAEQDNRETEIKRCILRDDELVMDFVYETRQYNVALKRQAGYSFQGKWSTKEFEGPIVCRLFRSDDDVFLFGEFTEDGINYHWWSDLNSVDQFDDEG